MGSCECSWKEDANIGIRFVSSSSNTSRENQQNSFLNNLGFINVNRTVSHTKQSIYSIW